jgi:hypothetical protein
MITKLKIFKENILVPRNLEGREDKYKQQQARLFQQEIINGDIYIDKDFYLDFQNIKCKKIIGYVWIHIDKIPLWFKNIEIDGNFVCYNNGLITLEGSPQIVNGGFYCGGNKLTTLKGCPKYVDKNFWCCYNKAQFTEEDVRKLCNVKGQILV